MMRKYYTTFSEKNLTGNAGLVHLGRFAEKLGIQKLLDTILTVQRAPNADYQVSDAVIMLMRLLTRSRRWQLRLSKNYPFKERWTYLEDSIQGLSFA